MTNKTCGTDEGKTETGLKRRRSTNDIALGLHTTDFESPLKKANKGPICKPAGFSFKEATFSNAQASQASTSSQAAADAFLDPDIDLGQNQAGESLGEAYHRFGDRPKAALRVVPHACRLWAWEVHNVKVLLGLVLRIKLNFHCVAV